MFVMAVKGTKGSELYADEVVEVVDDDDDSEDGTEASSACCRCHASLKFIAVSMLLSMMMSAGRLSSFSCC